MLLHSSQDYSAVRFQVVVAKLQCIPILPHRGKSHPRVIAELWQSPADRRALLLHCGQHYLAATSQAIRGELQCIAAMLYGCKDDVPVRNELLCKSQCQAVLPHTLDPLRLFRVTWCRG